MVDEDAPVLLPVTEEKQWFLDSAIASYMDSLDTSVPAVEYLKSRGLTQADAQRFKLGIVGDPAPGHHRFEGMLAIPYLDRHDRVLTIRFRCLEDHEHRDFYHGKYNSLSHDPSRIYNVRELHHSDSEIHVTEGEMDAIILNKIGLHAIGLPGAKSFKARHRRALAGFSVVWVWGDPDQAGGEFTDKVVGSLRQARPVAIKGGDVNEVFLRHGAGTLLRLVER